MEHAFVISLAVVTSLQLCRAEIPGTWYSANVINNGDFLPKPISEIFSTETPFSPTNPIVVLSSSTPAPNYDVSTSVPKVVSSTFLTSTPYTPDVSVSSTPSPGPTPVFVETKPTRPPQTPTFTYSTRAPINPPQSTSTIFTAPESSSTFFTSPPDFQPELINRQQFPFPVPPSSPGQNQPNYFLIYQQAPQSMNYPTGPQQTFSTGQPISSTFQPEFSTPQSTLFLQPEISTPQSTISTFRPEVTTMRPTFSTIPPEITSPQTTFSTIQPEISSPGTLSTFRTTLAPTSSSPPAIRTSTLSSTLRTTRTAPCANPSATSAPRISSLRIRMISPKGSITNINVNQPPLSTTKRPTTRRSTTVRTTTTRPRRTRKNKNTFDACVNACSGGRSPICAAPLSAPLESDTLKGFPSICHMACHNSFKSNQYEMVVEGRCGRLRTRIRPVDSNNKLTRNELNRAQYTVVNSDPNTILEFEPR